MDYMTHNSLSLSASFFWDVDADHLDIDKNKRLIIERVFSLGNRRDIAQIVNYYGIPVIKDEIIKAGNLDDKTLNWISLVLNIPKEKFRCYEMKSLRKIY